MTGVKDGTAFARFGLADEQPVLLAQRRGTNGIFYAEMPVMPRSGCGG